MGTGKSKLEKLKKLNKQNKQDCITKAIKIILSSDTKKNSATRLDLNYKQYNHLTDLLKLKSMLDSSSNACSDDDDLANDLNDSKSYEKLIDHNNQDYVDDLSHDSLASSFIFTSAQGLQNMRSATMRPAQFTPKIFYSSLGRPALSQSRSHVRIYHDIYFF